MDKFLFQQMITLCNNHCAINIWEDGVPLAPKIPVSELGSLVWARNGGRGKLPNIHYYNTNFLSPSNRRFQVNHKTLPLLVMFIR